MGWEELTHVPVFLRCFDRSVGQVGCHSLQSMLRGLDLHSDVTPYVTEDAALMRQQFQPHAVSQPVPPNQGGKVGEIHGLMDELIHPTARKVSARQSTSWLQT